MCFQSYLSKFDTKLIQERYNRRVKRNEKQIV